MSSPPSGRIEISERSPCLRNEKQRQRNRLVRENLERYKNEQPVIDSERQLSGKVVDEEVMGALQRTGYMTPQHILLIDTIMTMPEATVEAEYGRRVAAINAVNAFCDMEEGAPSQLCPSRKDLATDIVPSLHLERQECPQEDVDAVILCLAIASVCVKTPEQRPTICFLCVGDSRLSIKERTRIYKTAGSLTRHVRRKHVNLPWPEGNMVKCKVCDMDLKSKMHLMNHAETVHGTVSRVPL
jgi:hypothetical protein